MSEKKCRCGKDIRESQSHDQNCEALFSPDYLASIAESLAKIANPLIAVSPQPPSDLAEVGKQLGRIADLVDAIMEGRVSFTPGRFVQQTASGGNMLEREMKITVAPKESEVGE